MKLLLMTVMLASFLAGGDLKTLARGTLSALDTRREAVARSETEWRTLWNEHAPGEPLPKVDFEASMVVAVFLGSRMTAGYDVTITSVEPQSGGAVVRYRENRPAADQMVAQVITSPFHIVTTPRIAGQVTFTEDGGRGR